MSRKFCQQIEEYINKPTRREGGVEEKKSTNTISSYKNTFDKLFKITGIAEKDFVAGEFDASVVVTKLRESDIANATRLNVAKIAYSFLKYCGKEKPELTKFVDELAGTERQSRGKVRSDEEHELYYVDTNGKLEKVENAITKYLESKSTDERRRLTLLAAYLMLIVPLRPSEAVSIGKVKENFANYIDHDASMLVITQQKSKTVGKREKQLPKLFMQLAYVDASSNFLFPAIRGGSEGATAAPMTRNDYTEQLIKPVTLEFFGKEVSSRALRTSVISNKTEEMKPEERVQFAKECGHHHTTQIDHYAVFKPKSKIEIKIKEKIKEIVSESVSKSKCDCKRSYRDGEFILQNIPFSKLKEISQLVTTEQINEVSFVKKEECYITLKNIPLGLSIQIEELFD